LIAIDITVTMLEIWDDHSDNRLDTKFQKIAEKWK